MDLELGNRTALVTGASSGIGASVAMALAAEGVAVVAAARRVALIERGTTQLSDRGAGTITPMRYNALEQGAAANLAIDANRLLGRVDIVVNAAGGARQLGPTSPPAAWDEAMTLNFNSARELTHELVAGMVERCWGRVINFTGSSEPPGSSGSSAAKAAIQAWSKSLSRDVGVAGVTVNCIQPGRIRSEQVARLFPTIDDEAAEIARMDIPLRRFGEPEDVAKVVVFLASNAASYVSGTVIPVDGGMRRFAF